MNTARKALDLLAEKGWIKGDLSSPKGRCILGALHAAGDKAGDHTYWTIQTVVEEQYPERTVSNLSPIQTFNDHKDTTFEDVVRVMEKAAVKIDE